MHSEGLVVDKGKIQEDDKPKDFEALQRELLEDERAGVSAAEVKTSELDRQSPVTDATEHSPVSVSSSEEAEIQLQEIRASETWSSRQAAPRRPQQQREAELAPGEGAISKFKRMELPVFLGPPPPHQAPSTGLAACVLLVGNLPWWLSDAELRKHAEQFGPVRAIRILDKPKSGKSLGIAMVAYVSPDSSLKAAHPAEGICSLPIWAVLKVAKPRYVTVSAELFGRLKAGQVPWVDGGPCSKDLRRILMRQFDLAEESTRLGKILDRAPPPGRPQQPRRPAPPKRTYSDASNGRGSLARAPSRETEKPTEEAWTDKLRMLKMNVNSTAKRGRFY